MTNQPDTTIHDDALMYAAGTLPLEDMERFESRLLAGDREYVDAFRNVQAVADAAFDSVREVEPDLIARSDLLNALQIPKTPAEFASGVTLPDPFSEDPAAMVLMRGGDIDWRETGVPGVKARNLFVDRESNRLTVLLELAPGTVYPDHDHDGVEECLVLDGDLELGGKTLRKFDYIRIPKGGQHGTPRTTNGCLLLVVSPLAA